MIAEKIGKVKPRDPPHDVDFINDISFSMVQGGPWKTKSDAQLELLFAIPLDVVDYLTSIVGFFNYNSDETALILPHDIRGFRCYSVSNIKAGKTGGSEFHRIRSEVIACIDGLVEMSCDDVYGAHRSCLLEPGRGLYVPPFIKHTYCAVQDRSRLVVLANTLFDPANKMTHDTYSAEDFNHLVEHFKQPARR